MKEILIFFFDSLHITISPEKAFLYAEFILAEVKKNIDGLKLEMF